MKSLKKTIFASAVIIGANTLLFQGFTQAVTVSEFKQTHVIPTKYANAAAGPFQAAPNSLPDGYKKKPIIWWEPLTLKTTATKRQPARI